MSADTYSYINMILLSLLGGVITSLAGLLGYWASHVNKALAEMRKDVQGVQKAAHTLEEWSRAHDKQDDERHEESKQTLVQIRDLSLTQAARRATDPDDPRRPRARGRL